MSITAFSLIPCVYLNYFVDLLKWLSWILNYLKNDLEKKNNYGKQWELQGHPLTCKTGMFFMIRLCIVLNNEHFTITQKGKLTSLSVINKNV